MDLLAVLRSRQEAVDDAFTELFLRVRSTPAADSADVGSRRTHLGWRPGVPAGTSGAPRPPERRSVAFHVERHARPRAYPTVPGT